MIEFRKITVSDKEKYEKAMNDAYTRGCEFSFANAFMWGEQRICEICGQTVMLATFGEKTIYPFPLGKGEKRPAIEAIISDSKERGIPCVISGIPADGKELFERDFSDVFEISTNEGSYDYVYAVSDLADLVGRKYASKRNHCKRIETEHPDAKAVVVTEELFDKIRSLCESWYAERSVGEDDFCLERLAIARALENYKALGLVGIAIMDKDELLAFTLGSRMNEDTFDVHFEKARSEVIGAYALVNREFARHVRENYPEIKYLDREEDMGLPGLRKAKESYYPHHRIVKYKARLVEK